MSNSILRRYSLLLLIFLIGVSCSQEKKRRPYALRINQNYYDNAAIYRNTSSGLLLNQNDSIAVRDRWLSRELLYQEALSKHLDKDPLILGEVNSYKRDLLANKFLDIYFSEKISVSDDEIVKYYQDNRSSFRLTTDQARIVHYLFDNLDDANSSKRILLYGDASQKNSLTERFMPEEKLVTQGMLIKILDDAVFDNPRPNEIIGPLHSEYGYHVIEVKEYFPKDTYLPVAEVRQSIRERIGNTKKQQEYQILVNNLKDKYDIEFR